MPTRKEELEIAVLELPVGERAELARRLIESLDNSDADNFDAEWIEESERRYAAYRAQVTLGRPGDEVFRKAKARLE